MDKITLLHKSWTIHNKVLKGKYTILEVGWDDKGEISFKILNDQLSENILNDQLSENILNG